MSDCNQLNISPASRAQEPTSKHLRTQSDFPCKAIETGRSASNTDKAQAETEPELHPGRHLHGGAETTGDSKESMNIQGPRRVTLNRQRSAPVPTLSSPVSSVEAGAPVMLATPTSVDHNGLNLQYANDKRDAGSESDSRPQNHAVQKPMKGDQANGVDFKALVDRLLSPATSKTNVKFIAIFLCLYRQFSSPLILLAAIISRFENVDREVNPQAMRLSTQLRYLGVLATWVSEYPGDFAHPLTRHEMTTFISALAGQRQFSMTIKEINTQLEAVSEDDDDDWASSDADRGVKNTVQGSSTVSVAQNVSPTSAAKTSIEDAPNDACSEEKGSHTTDRRSATSSTTSSTGKSSSRSNASFQASMYSEEHAHPQTRLLTIPPRGNLSKIHWHHLMDAPDEDIAGELTRIDWTLYSSIRPRDLIRHVSLCEEDKKKCSRLGNVRRMIDQFNHTAFWIANIILLREKPKHRARALEKCMSIAWVSRAGRPY